MGGTLVLGYDPRIDSFRMTSRPPAHPTNPSPQLRLARGFIRLVVSFSDLSPRLGGRGASQKLAG